MSKPEKVRGVVYFATLPPFMKPQKLRHLLQQHGNVTRLFMVPEDQAKRRQRAKKGGNAKQKYLEGWAEFSDKRTAKRVALKLNGAPIGGRSKKNFHYYDLWCVKYLSGFKWEQLSESVVYESKTKQARLRAEMSKTKKRNEYFIEQITKAKEIEGILARKDNQQGKNTRRQPVKIYQHERSGDTKTEAQVLEQII